MDKLSEFVKEQMKTGVKPAELKDHLVKNGWKEEEVNSAINNNQGHRKKNRILIAILGVVLVGIMALVLISFAKNTTPDDNIQIPVTNNAGGELQNVPVNNCNIIETSIEKDECYKTILKTGFDCDTLTDSIEKTYCTRAYEDINLQGVERIVEG